LVQLRIAPQNPKTPRVLISSFPVQFLLQPKESASDSL